MVCEISMSNKNTFAIGINLQLLLEHMFLV